MTTASIPYISKPTENKSLHSLENYVSEHENREINSRDLSENYPTLLARTIRKNSSVIEKSGERSYNWREIERSINGGLRYLSDAKRSEQYVEFSKVLKNYADGVTGPERKQALNIVKSIEEITYRFEVDNKMLEILSEEDSEHSFAFGYLSRANDEMNNLVDA